jgi:CRISPR/Cas system CMR subunit Cmr6 (Cas7 group RAMP superfamily)
LIEKALNKLKEKGIGAKTKDGWGRFEWEEIS